MKYTGAMNTGARIQEARLRKVYSRSELARLSGITYKSLLHIETGKTDPRYSTVRRIAEVLDVDPYDLVTPQ